MAATLEKDVLLDSTLLYLSTIDDITLDTILAAGNESFQVTYINEDDKTVTVVRASYNTTSEVHVSGTEVYKVVDADNDLIEPGDPFLIQRDILS